MRRYPEYSIREFAVCFTLDNSSDFRQGCDEASFRIYPFRRGDLFGLVIFTLTVRRDYMEAAD